MSATKKAKVTFTCEHEMKDFLTQWAESENRTLSNLVETLIAEAIETKQQDNPESDKSKRKGKAGN